ncbi:MAG TPA: TIGR02757 family protein [Treponema sp.]|nr:TIGR02757 family protein [Treponema sp.]
MTEELKVRLVRLADIYESPSFLTDDPAQFMHRYGDIRDAELVAFIAANLAFGRRTLILQHVELILAAAGDSLAEWIAGGGYERLFPQSGDSFYRVFSFRSMRLLCDGLRHILCESPTLGDYFKKKYSDSGGRIPLVALIGQEFPPACTIICHGARSAAKRLHLFLRWMVRDNSPVDMGFWAGWYSKEQLLVPLDTHVLQQSAELGLLRRTASGRLPAPSLGTAVALSAELAEAFPGDPARGDFALFGLGVAGGGANP